MADPITLALVGTVALTEGIKFLYGQATEILKLWRARKEASKTGDASSEPKPVEVKLPEAVFEGQLSNPKVHFENIPPLENGLKGLHNELSQYANDIEPINSQDEEVLKKVDALRQILEAVYQQRITFKGEKTRPTSGPTIEGHIDVGRVEGVVRGVKIRGPIDVESITSKIKTGDVGPEGEVTGIDLDTTNSTNK
jgi:hypothetical protein